MKHAIVTGASKGLGKAIARELAMRGYDVLLVARSQELLEEEALQLHQHHKVNIYALGMDLTESSAPAQIIDWCQHHSFHPSVLVNNAGYACWGYFEKIPLTQQLNMLQLNITALVTLTHALLPLLKKNEAAYILNVASTSAFQAVPTLSLYAASKAFVRSFSRALRFELRKTTVSVTCVTPGPMTSDFMDRAGMDAMKETAKKFEMPASKVASAAVDSLFKRKGEIVPGFTNYLTGKLSNIVPDSLLEKIASKLYESKLPH